MDFFEVDFGYSMNFFDEQDFLFFVDDEINFFLDDIRVVLVVVLVLFFGGNFFEEMFSIGEINRLIYYLYKILDGLNFGLKNV